MLGAQLRKLPSKITKKLENFPKWAPGWDPKSSENQLKSNTDLGLFDFLRYQAPKRANRYPQGRR